MIHNNVYKIADLGYCKKLSHIKDLTNTTVGSPLYMAPENLNAKGYDSKTDISSLGVLYYQMLFKSLPFQADSAEELARIVNCFDSLRFENSIPVSQGSKELLK